MSVKKHFSCMAVGLVFGLALPATAADNDVLVEGPTASVSQRELLVETAKAPDEARKRLFAEPNALASAATNLYVRRVLAQRARDEGLQDQELIAINLRLLEERVLSDAYMAKVARAAVPDDATLEKLAATEYKAFPERFERPEQVHVRHILIVPANDPSARQNAESLLAELKAGGDFAKLALKYSADAPSAGKGGDLGYIVRGKTVAPFEAAAFALKEKGQLSDIVETQYGYHIIRLEDRLDKAPQSFDDVKGQLKAKLANDFGRQALAELTQKASAEARPNEEAIQALTRKAE